MTPFRAPLSCLASLLVVACASSAPGNRPDDAGSAGDSTTFDDSGALPDSGASADAAEAAAPDASAPADAGRDAAGPWTPKSLPHLALWLDGSRGVTAAAGGNVSKWADQSANGNDVIQQNASLQPKLASLAINNLDGIYFPSNGSPVSLVVASPQNAVMSGDFFVMVVYKSTLPSSSFADIFSIEATSTTNAILQLSPPMLMASVTVGGNGKFTQPSQSNFSDGNPHVAGMRRTGGRLDAYGDASGGSATGVPTGDVSGKLVVGSQLLGTIAEVIVDSGTVDDAQVANAQAYLKKKYALSF